MGNFTILPKLLYGILQALHHLYILETEKGKGRSSPAFSRKLNDLDRFVKPAQKNDGIIDKIKRINRLWLSNVTDSLASHYSECISAKFDILKTHEPCSSDIHKAMDIAKKWGMKNLGRKLNSAVIKKFERMVNANLLQNQSAPSSPLIRPPTPNATVPNSDVTRMSVSGNTSNKSTAPEFPFETGNSKIEINFLSEPSHLTSTPNPGAQNSSSVDRNSFHTSQTAGPSKISSLSESDWPTLGDASLSWEKPNSTGRSVQIRSMSDFSSPNSFIALRLEETSLDLPVQADLPSPSPKPKSLPKIKLARKVQNVTIAFPKSPPSQDTHREPTPVPSPPFNNSDLNFSKPKIRIHPNTRQKFQNWSLEKIDRPVLLFGDSNLKNIPPKDIPACVHVQCFPGAKFEHLDHLVQGYDHDTKPEMIIVSAGINSRTQNYLNTSKRLFERMRARILKKFPDSKLKIIELNFSSELEKKAQDQLEAINKGIWNEADFGRLQVVPAIPASKFKTDLTDHIHWTVETGTKLITHWCEFLHLN